MWQRVSGCMEGALEISIARQRVWGGREGGSRGWGQAGAPLSAEPRFSQGEMRVSQELQLGHPHRSRCGHHLPSPSRVPCGWEAAGGTQGAWASEKKPGASNVPISD